MKPANQLRTKNMKTSRKTNLKGVGFLVLSLFMAPGAYASLLGTHVSISALGTGETVNDYSYVNNTSSSAVSAVGSEFSVSASASAQYGALKVYTSGAVNVPMRPNSEGSFPNLAAISSAQYSDQLTIQNASLEGKKGLLTYAVKNDLLIDADSYYLYSGQAASARYALNFGSSTAYMGIDNASAQLSVRIAEESARPYFYSNATYYTDDFYGVNYDYTPNVQSNLFFLTQEFVFGTPVTFWMTSSADGDVPGYYYQYSSEYFGSFLVDAGNSSYWAGIQAVTVDGQEITDYSVISASGTDYSRSFVPAAIPEPETYAMMLAGLSLVGWATRRRKLALA